MALGFRFWDLGFRARARRPMLRSSGVIVGLSSPKRRSTNALAFPSAW
jgi:hypothetical protein